MIKKFLKSKDTLIFSIVVIILVAAPFNLSDFRMNLLGKFICYAIVAIGIDLIWGYTGILSLGQGVFFGLGAYCMAMYLKLNSSNGKLPDFMDWSGLTKLPEFWKPFNSPVFAIIMAILVPVAIAFLLGYFTFRNRITGVYFSILSQALSIIFGVIFVGQQSVTGGSNGITNFDKIFGFSLKSPSVKAGLYYISLAFLIFTFIVCKLIAKGRLGRILIAIRDGENKLRFEGYNPTTYKVFVYCLSAAFAGIAGALFVGQVGIITPDEMGIVASIEMVIWVAVGGRGTIVGAVIGTLIMNIIKTGVSENFPSVWSYFLGAIFIIVVVFLPGGIMGIFKNIFRFRKEAA
ncbi:urea transport system permease protein [Clostridium algifaecis]|uniref:Urea transport system permease protein n=1 Tax=Clostridium algifaecis TaxID=1472040 RepID=A0ABS4KQJ9_9CLOT|nr:urea ABC transporter permease subunit UrtC [Clostridium algifaecis]MBP2032328.1 urea transport system permease protein [Clostridium algifaecis]